MKIESGKYYLTSGGHRIGPMVTDGRYYWSKEDLTREYTAEGVYWNGPGGAEEWTIVSEWIEEPAVFRTDGARADLAVAYPLSDDIIGFTLNVAGKPQQFTMKRSAAASFIGRMAEVLAK